jgi:hypothetical protein
MPKVVIEAERGNPPACVTLIELSPVDGIYTLACTGDRLDECPTAGFEPAGGYTWSNRDACIAAGEVHIAAHERRVCGTCNGQQVFLGAEYDDEGEFVGRYGCELGHVEVIR